MKPAALTLTTDCCLILFDAHEAVEWVHRILDQERGSFTHLLLGGDYFDGWFAPPGGAARMCHLLRDLRQEHGDKLTVLLGNHDICYASSTDRGRRPPRIYPGDFPHHCSGYSSDTGATIRRELGTGFWDECRMIQVVNDHLISHAGVAPEFWRTDLPLDGALAVLEAEAGAALEDVAHVHSPILGAGVARGGEQPRGGLIWLDFDDEFEDALPLPQIVGHTAHLGPRRKGRSWCLDGGRTCYGLLDKDGRLEVRTA